MKRRSAPLRAFLLLLGGQVLSAAGTSMSGFALGIWALQRTHSVTLYSLIVTCSLVPQIVLAPLAGALADRWSPRATLLISEIGGGGCSALLLGLAALGFLDERSLLPCVVLRGSFLAFEPSALSAITVALVPGRLLERANGLIQVGSGIAQLAGPVLGGLVLKHGSIVAVCAFDVASFAIALATTLLSPSSRAARGDGRRPFVRWSPQDLLGGLSYLRSLPSLRIFLFLAAVSNATFGMAQVLFAPIVLGFSRADTLGVVYSFGGLGYLVGSFLASWRCPDRKIRGVLGLMVWQAATLCLSIAHPTVWLASAGAFGFVFAIPIIATCITTSCQRLAPPEAQGRVGAIRFMVANLSYTLAWPAGGALVDRIFEPSMTSGGLLSKTVGPVLGRGPGRGAAVLTALLALLLISVVALTLSRRAMRLLIHLEAEGEAASEACDRVEAGHLDSTPAGQHSSSSYSLGRPRSTTGANDEQSLLFPSRK